MLHPRCMTGLSGFILVLFSSEYNLSLPPENIRKAQGFLMLSGGRERLHRVQMG